MHDNDMPTARLERARVAPPDPKPSALRGTGSGGMHNDRGDAHGSGVQRTTDVTTRHPRREVVGQPVMASATITPRSAAVSAANASTAAAGPRTRTTRVTSPSDSASTPNVWGFGRRWRVRSGIAPGQSRRDRLQVGGSRNSRIAETWVGIRRRGKVARNASHARVLSLQVLRVLQVPCVHSVLRVCGVAYTENNTRRVTRCQGCRQQERAAC
jgi:hypothetical protein